MGTDVITTPKRFESLKDNASPQHRVYLDAFYIDKYPVTNAEYAEFLNLLGQSRRACGGYDCAFTRFAGTKYYPVIVEYPGSPTTFQVLPSYERLPVKYVSWYGAQAYCEWRGKRLPTEAEWEKAGRSTDGQRYPWGNVWDDRFQPKGNHPVGSDPMNVSPYGVADMLGSNGEWVFDWYAANYYQESPQRNPQGPNVPPIGPPEPPKVVRSDTGYQTVLMQTWGLSFRSFWPASDAISGYGFRCAMPANGTP